MNNSNISFSKQDSPWQSWLEFMRPSAEQITEAKVVLEQAKSRFHDNFLASAESVNEPAGAFSTFMTSMLNSVADKSAIEGAYDQAATQLEFLEKRSETVERLGTLALDKIPSDNDFEAMSLSDQVAAYVQSLLTYNKFSSAFGEGEGLSATEKFLVEKQILKSFLVPRVRSFENIIAKAIHSSDPAQVASVFKDVHELGEDLKLSDRLSGLESELSAVDLRQPAQWLEQVLALRHLGQYVMKHGTDTYRQIGDLETQVLQPLIGVLDRATESISNLSDAEYNDFLLQLRDNADNHPYFYCQDSQVEDVLKDQCTSRYSRMNALARFDNYKKFVSSFVDKGEKDRPAWIAYPFTKSIKIVFTSQFDSRNSDRGDIQKVFRHLAKQACFWLERNELYDSAHTNAAVGLLAEIFRVSEKRNIPISGAVLDGLRQLAPDLHNSTLNLSDFPLSQMVDAMASELPGCLPLEVKSRRLAQALIAKASEYGFETTAGRQPEGHYRISII